MSTVLTWATVTAALRLAIPVTLAALGALVNQRAGVLNCVVGDPLVARWQPFRKAGEGAA